ncbi:unnamed protein product [Brassicogethes aeneus]|uniref:CHCH domain-containing protein n=1 Tax=Brassicogethes aeneus TaxID=1431903 RepID=A0A9P0ATA3_BRAAE|nr:unnamed protein product [Brassicogethes aeneus]
MRYTAALFKSKVARPIPQEPVPFQEILPLKLKPAVSGKGDRTSEVCCLQEMSVMLACFKKNEFSQQLCSKEIDSFQKCYTGHLATKKVKKDKEAKGVLTPGEKQLSSKQVNTLLKKFPNFK